MVLEHWIGYLLIIHCSDIVISPHLRSSTSSRQYAVKTVDMSKGENNTNL